MKRKMISLLFLVFALTAVKAQRLLTLDEAISTALQNNYEIRLSKNDSLVAALDYSYRNAAFLPTLNGTVGATWNTNDQRQTLADGSKREQNNLKSANLNASLALSWTLFDGFRMFATRDKARELLELGGLTVKNQVVNTVADVVVSYYNIVAQKQQLLAITEQMGVSEERVRLAQNRLDIGVGAKPDVLQSRVDLNAQKANILTQETIMAQVKEELNRLMNVPAGTQYDVVDSIPINKLIGLGEIQNDIENNNPQLLIARKNIDIASITMRELKADQYPRVAFNSIYNFSRTDNKAVINPFSPLFNQNLGFNYGFTVTIPILNNFNSRRLIRQAQLDINFQKLVYENQRSLVNLGVLNAFIAYEQQKRALALEEENIILAKENVAIILEVFRLGATTIIQLREAQLSLQDAYTRLITARFNTKVSETELLRLKGEIIR